MSAFYPNFNIDALKQFAIETVAAEHRSRNAIGGTKQSNTVVQPRILSCRNLNWGGDEVRSSRLQFLYLIQYRMANSHRIDDND